MFKLTATIIKDIRILLRDRVGLVLMFVMPIILVVVVTSIQNSTFQLVNKNKLPLLVCNNDTGVLSTQFIAAINKVGMFKVLPVTKLETGDKLTSDMRSNDAMLAMIIPSDFSAKVRAKAKNIAGKALNSFGLQGDTLKKANGKEQPITLYYNPILQESLRLSVQGALRSALQLIESRETLRTLYFSINEKPLPQSQENEMLGNQTTINEVMVAKDSSRGIPNASQHNVPAWTIFAMFFIIMSLGGSVVREKISGSFIRLKTLPTNYLVALLSKQITYLAVTVLQASVIFSMGVWFFPVIGLPALNLPADIAGLFLVTLICGWCAVSYAICIGVFAKTQEQANGFGAVSVVILAAVGGLMVPSFAMQDTMKSLSNLSPLHWCLEAYYGLFLSGGKFADVLTNIIPLVLITLLLQGITFIALKKKNLI